METGSTWSVNCRRMSNTSDDTAEYLAMSGRNASMSTCRMRRVEGTGMRLDQDDDSSGQS
jgi:hypothetical protein